MSREEQKSLLTQALLGAGLSTSKSMKPEDMIDTLQREGYKIVKDDPGAQKGIAYVKSMAVERWEGGERLKFGVASDTQLGSRKQQLTFLNMVYDRYADEGIDTVLHPGDVCDGDGRVYPGQQYDLHKHGFEAQLDYITEVYPLRKGMKTIMIAGNHDWSFWQRGGADILSELARRRSDIQYLGYGGAKVNLNGLNIYLIHLKAGLTYARSYKVQKIIEQFAPKEKPDLLFAGDKHSWVHMPMYRNVNAWQMGCFQAQTDHEKRLGLYPEIGGLIVEVHYGTKGADKRDTKKPGHEGRVSVVEHSFRVLPQYVPLESDY